MDERRYQEELAADEGRRVMAEARFREIWESNFGEIMAENWGNDWDEKLCDLVRRNPGHPFSVEVAKVIERAVERDARDEE
jgi:hypothetical protein